MTSSRTRSGRRLAGLLERLLPVRRDRDLVARAAEVDLHEPGDVRIVVDDEDRLRASGRRLRDAPSARGPNGPHPPPRRSRSPRPRTSAPACTHRDAVSRFTPPSTCTWTSRSRRSISERSASILATASGWNGWPAHPGSTARTTTSSAFSRSGERRLRRRPRRERDPGAHPQPPPSAASAQGRSRPRGGSSPRRSPPRRARRGTRRAPPPAGARGAGRSVCGRSAATTIGPIVRGGTKCPSMTSIWMRSACSPTSLTSSARRARSADRMDAPSLATARHPSREGLLARGRPRRTSRRSRAACGQRRIQFGGAVGPGDLDGFELGDAAHDRVARGVGLGARERADAVDEPAAGRSSPAAAVAIPTCSAGEARELVLRARHRSSGRRRAEPMPEHGASTRTRSNPPARPAGGRPGRERSAFSAETLDGGPDQLEPRERHVGGHHASLRPDETGEVAGLAAGAGAHVQHPVARLRIQRPHDERRRLVLDREPALGELRQRRGRPRVDHQRVRVHRSAFGLDAGARPARARARRPSCGRCSRGS